MSAHPRLPGALWQAGSDLRDAPQRWPVETSRRPYDGGFLQVREDDVRGPDGSVFTRVVVTHRGAVGVVALDDEDRVLLLRQYRHPPGMRLLEIPAGLLDVADEPAVDAAGRELAEEAGVVAHDWSPLLDLWSSPGMTDEHWQVFLARGLEAVAEAERVERVHEEADLDVVWVPLAEAVRAVLDRRLTDSMAAAGILAAAAVAPASLSPGR